MRCMARRFLGLRVGFVALAAVFYGCSGDSDTTNTKDTGVRVLSLSASSLAVGEQVRVSGKGFVSPDNGWVDLTFVGKFFTKDKSKTEEVNFTVPLQAGDDGSLDWKHFGAYRIPFGPGDQLGDFVGEVHATNRFYDGSAATVPSSTGLPVQLGVTPSIVLVEAKAIGKDWEANCKYPITTAISLVPYMFRLRAVGFEPTEFSYTFGPGLLQDGSPTTGETQVSRAMLENDHAFLVRFAEVPENVDGFTTSISVNGKAKDGTSYRLDLPIVVRRPLQVFFNTPTVIAQTYHPEPVSGCIPGGQGSVEVTYSELRAETRSRSVAVNVSEGWTQNYGTQFSKTYGEADMEGASSSQGRTSTVTDGTSKSWSDSTTLSSSRTDSLTRTTQFNFSQTDSDNHTYTTNKSNTDSTNNELGGEASVSGTVGGKVEGNAGVPLVANGKVEVSASTTVGLKVQGKHGWGSSNVEGDSTADGRTRTASASYGASTAAGSSVSEGVARSLGAQWGVSQTYSEANSYSTTKQQSKTRSYSDAKSESESIGKQFSEGTTVTETVSTTDTKGLNTKGTIPAGSYGIWYRQATRLMRKGTVVAYDLCGNGDPVGIVVLDDWTWAPDLAIGLTCSTPSNLPEAACIVSPCGS